MQWSLEGVHWAWIRLYLPSAFPQCSVEMEAGKLQLGKEKDALIQRMLEQSQDLEGKRGALTPSCPWVRTGPAGLVCLYTAPLQVVMAVPTMLCPSPQSCICPHCAASVPTALCLSPQSCARPHCAVSVPTELQQRQRRLQELEKEWERCWSLVQKCAHLEQDYGNLQDEVALHRVRAWQGNWSLQAGAFPGCPGLGTVLYPGVPGCAQPFPVHVPTLSSRL